MSFAQNNKAPQIHIITAVKSTTLIKSNSYKKVSVQILVFCKGGKKDHVKQEINSLQLFK